MFAETLTAALPVLPSAFFIVVFETEALTSLSTTVVLKEPPIAAFVPLWSLEAAPTPSATSILLLSSSAETTRFFSPSEVKFTVVPFISA